jgi:uncharacterized protein YgiM (DUF1202 family)
MWKSLRYLLILLLLLPAALPAQAQEVPAVIDRALADLSSRVGQTVTVGSLWAWQWEASLYPDTSLGCPVPGQAYAQVPTGGIRFLLDYRGVTYDYRVSTDGQIVILCDGVQPVLVDAPVTVPEAPVVTDPDARELCVGLLPSRLLAGEPARVFTNVPSLRLRDAPSLQGEIIARMPGGSALQVLDGPSCDPNGRVVWWQVEYAGLTGWTAESQGNFYFLDTQVVATPPELPTEPAEPVEPAPVDTEGAFICPDLLPTRLQAGEQARVTLAEQLRMNLRSAPGRASAIIGVIPVESQVTILEGPSCGPDNTLWWQVEHLGRTGWVAENDGGFYILEPLGPAAG